MKTIYNNADIEINGVQQIAAGGTGETTSTAALTALGAAPVSSPTFTGTVTIPNLTVTGNLSVQGTTTQIDTTVATTSSVAIDTNSTETALRITQRGSGDVLRVEDDVTNPDSTPFIINNEGKVGIGTATPNEVLTVSGNISATGQFLGNVTATGTTTSRSLANRFASVFNVRDFGAVGNGVTDDRNAFQAAFNAANAAGGGVVYMPPGRYRKADTAGNVWTIYSNTSLVGEGDQSVIFFDDRSTQVRSSNDMILTDSAGETSNIEFKNFKVEGTLLTELNVTNRKQCFTGNRINGLRFENITMVGLRYMATAFNNVRNGIFTNNRLEYVAFDGLRATSSQNVVFSNNTFKSVTDDCIAAHSYDADSLRAGGFVITGNTMDACQGIKVLGAKEVVISNNVMRRTLRSPIHIETTSPPTIAEGQTNTFSINVIGNTICDTFGISGTNNAIYIIYQNGRSKQSLAQQPGVSTEPYSYNYLANVNNGTTVKSGMYGINISNNIITRTLGNVSKYSDYGYGQLLDRNTVGLWSDPAVNDASGLTHGLLISNAVNGLSITNNHIQGLEYSGITLVNSVTSNIIDFNNCIVSENKIIDVKGFGLYITGTGSGQGASQIVINDNIFDIDPFFRNSSHNSNNTWASTTASYGINASGLRGLYASGNVFKNCATTGLENTPNPIYSAGKNFIYSDFTAGGLNDAGVNKGVRLIPAFKSTIVVPISGDPTSINYGKALNDIITTSWSQPTEGYYIRGAFIENANPVLLTDVSGIKYSVSGWWRLTTGNNHVTGVDWIEAKNYDSISNTLALSACSTTDILRITQSGTGNALVVEDSENPDSTPFVVNQYGQLISGSLSAFHDNAGLQITSDSATAPNSNIVLRRNSNDVNSSVLNFQKSRGTLTSSLSVQQNDILGTLIFSGTLSGSNLRQGASIRASADGVSVESLSSIPGRLSFLTTVSGDTAPTEKMRITHDGKVGIGTTSPSETLTVAASSNNAAVRINQRGEGYSLIVEDSTNPDATPFIVGNDGRVYIGSTQDLLNANLIIERPLQEVAQVASLYSRPLINSFNSILANGVQHVIAATTGNYTVGSIASFFAEGTNMLSQGVSATNVYGYHAHVTLSNTGLNNTGFYSNLSADGSKNYNFYANGLAPNYFNGSVGIGTVDANEKLTVVGNISASGNASFNSLSANLYVPYVEVERIAGSSSQPRNNNTEYLLDWSQTNIQTNSTILSADVTSSNIVIYQTGFYEVDARYGCYDIQNGDYLTLRLRGSTSPIINFTGNLLETLDIRDPGAYSGINGASTTRGTTIINVTTIPYYIAVSYQGDGGSADGNTRYYTVTDSTFRNTPRIRVRKIG